MLHPLPGLKNNIKREDRLTGPLFLWLVRYYTYERQNDTKRPARCAFHRARYTYPASPVMHIPVPRRGRRSCWPSARFCPLLPLLAKVGRSGERNIPAPEGAEPSLPEAPRRGPPHSSLYPWLRIKFTLSRQFSLTFTHVSMYTLVPMNFSMSRRARELMRLSISPPLPMIMPLWLAFSQ